MTLRLNADVGELPARVHASDDNACGEAALIAILDDANVACGGHAGDTETMRTTLLRCRRAGVRVIAHPSYPDRAGFGRARLTMPPAELTQSLVEQVRALADVAREVGVVVSAIKPHGALYHAIGSDAGVADAAADVVMALERDLGARLPLVLFHQATMAERVRARGVTVWREVFADRGTDASGELLPRDKPGAVLDADAAAAQARRLIDDVARGALAADTVCVHGDGPHATAIARAVRGALASA